MKMRLIHPDSSPLRIWVVRFLILSPIIGAAIFGIGMTFPNGYWILIPHAHWMLLGTLAIGAWIATRSTQAEMYKRKERREAAVNLPGEHPRLGAYRSWPYYSRWSAMMPLRSGAEPRVELYGKGLAPSDDDVALWLDRIAPQIDELIAAVRMKLDLEGPVGWITPKTELSPRGVDFCQGGDIEISFDAEPEPNSGDLPYASFSRNLELLEAYWSM